MEQIRDLLIKAVKTATGETVDIELTRPDEQFGDYATNVALQLGKKLAKNPREVAISIVEAIPKDTVIASAEIAGPGFINIRIQSAFLAEQLQQAIQTAPRGYGSINVGSGQTVICEFPSPNMAKPFSVGHIRPALQGWAIYKLMDFAGYETVRDNHIGDYGTPFGKWVVGYLRYSSPEQLKEGGVYELARIYIAITKDMKDQKAADKTELADEVQAWLVKLEAGDKEAQGYSEQFNKISLDHLHEMMRRLKIETDEELGESFYVKKGQGLVGELLEKGIALESKGAVVVDLEDQGIKTPIMLRKANGAALYATTDLATIDYRQQRWKPKAVFIHTGQEQAFYFQQLRALARKADYDDTINHLWHGLVDQIDESGNRAKMSSRKGVILFEELLDRALEKARELMSEGKASDVEAIALGAIKFADFKADRKVGVLFDWDTMFNVHGFSGPSVQYAAVRIKSILKKSDTKAAHDFADYNWDPEHQLLLQLTLFPDLIAEMAQNYEMHKLAHYLYMLTQAFNRYYEQVRILDAPKPDRSARLWLIGVVNEVITTGLGILGIPTPEHM